MKNKLDKRIDEALAESPCEDESVAEDENWWMDYAYIFADQIEEQYGHADRDQFLEFTHKIVEETKKRALDRPMGVSEWRAHGEKYGYWEFFEKEAKHLERERIRGMIEDKLEWYEELGGRINHSTLRDILSKLSNE